MAFRLKNLTFARSVGVMLLVLATLSTAHAEPKQPALLHVRGEAQLQVAPDQAVIGLGVVSEAKTAKSALEENSLSMRKVMDGLLSIGLKQDDLVTQRFGVQPVWSVRPRNADPQWRSEIIGYRVDNTLSVTVTDLDQVGDVIAIATEKGANTVNSVAFGLANPREFRQLAIERAVTNAKVDAEVAATAAGAKIIGIEAIHLDQAVASVEQVEKAMLMRAASADMTAPPINSGDITVRASVSMTYQLDE